MTQGAGCIFLLLISSSLILGQSCQQSLLENPSPSSLDADDTQKILPPLANAEPGPPLGAHPTGTILPPNLPDQFPIDSSGFGGGSQGFLHPIAAGNSDDDKKSVEPCRNGQQDNCQRLELICSDGSDDDSDGLIDCSDPDCSTKACNDGNGCTFGDSCVASTCQGAPLICNDDNPCTTDSCSSNDNGATCVYTNRTDIEDMLGACEVDGDPCTIAKCTLSDPENSNSPFICFEQDRKFISNDTFGCKDDNQCTADSCLVSCGDDIPVLQAGPGACGPVIKDATGNANINGNFLCINEVMEDTACFVENECKPGICAITGLGIPDAEFEIECLSLPSESPLSQCPSDQDGNDCTFNACVVGEGCVSQFAQTGTPCDIFSQCLTEPTCDGEGECAGIPTNGASCIDFNPCTVNDTCRGSSCVGTVVENGTPCNDFFNECVARFCQAGECVVDENTNPCDDNNPCTLDSCDDVNGCAHDELADNTPGGGPCTIAEQIGICAEGAFVCIGGEASTQCASLYAPRVETCNGLDDDCDGSTDEELIACEICNGIDDDENNLIDDLPANQECAKFVFVTSSSFDGNLGGVIGADQKCTTAAQNSGNANINTKTFRAWISDGLGYSPATSDAFHANGPYRLIDGTIVANNWADLSDGSIQNDISTNELGMMNDFSFASTATLADGTAFGLLSCSNWTSTSNLENSFIGLAGATDSGWTAFGAGPCNIVGLRLYCFEQ